jgi:hypothetical protein
LEKIYEKIKERKGPKCHQNGNQREHEEGEDLKSDG